jgi:pimeloyl-ACP methyl ester carboxylesterase
MNSFTSGLITLNDTQLYVEQSGAGHPLILLHGFTFDLRMWGPQLDKFNARFQVIRYDRRGSGRSDFPEEKAYSHAVDLAGLMDYLDIKKAHILGLSRGGAAAIDFALAYPDRVNRLIIADSAPIGFERRDPPPSGFDRVTTPEELIDAKQKWIAHPLFAPAMSNPKSKSFVWQMVADYSGWHWINPDPIFFHYPDAPNHFPKITAPTLLLVGDQDMPDYQRAADEMLGQIPNAKKIVIPNAGHISNLENPEAFNQAVIDFLTE